MALSDCDMVNCFKFAACSLRENLIPTADLINMKSLDVIMGFLEMLMAIGSREIYQHKDTQDISVIFTYSKHTAKGAIVLMA